MKIIIPVIALLLVFLISYVNRYMIKRRKKEFALQTIIGMEQRTVATLFFIEMLLMGLVAVCLGVVLGVLLSQIASAIISNSLMLRLGDAYTGLVLIVISLTTLALQQLTDASEHKARFKVIEKIGVDKIQIKKLIRQQMSGWFGVPIVLALCGSGAIFIYLLKVNYGDYIPYITVNHVLMNVFIIYGVFLFVFICYLTVTYTLFKRNIAENE